MMATYYKKSKSSAEPKAHSAKNKYGEYSFKFYRNKVLRGLKQLHDLNILHRDLKCANIFLMKGMEVKLGDLNVSKVTKKGLGYTQTGTPYYTR